MLISIHAPTRGATEYGKQYWADHRISIHAPTRGATSVTIQKAESKKISIHAPTRGATRISYVLIPSFIFQSTLPRGERPLINFNQLVDLDFNPRSHEGSDDIYRLNPQMLIISIHAPTRGATYICFHYKIYVEFQSTLPRGERRSLGKFNYPKKEISIHAPTRGAT